MSLDKDGEAIVYAQVDANLDSNPKIRKAGSFGRQVFEFLLRRNALRGFKGCVPIAFVDPDYLADQLMVSRNDAVTGVTKAVTANLIEISEPLATVRIVGWHESWGRRAKEGKERTAAWRDRKRAEQQSTATTGDDSDEMSSQVTSGDESDAKNVAEQSEDIQKTHIRVRERHPAAGAIARRVWQYAAKLRGDLSALKLQLPPWGITVNTNDLGWPALLDRICEMLVESTPEHTEQVCMNRVAVAFSKAKADGDGQWFASATMFTRNSFASWAHLTPDQVARKPAKKREPGALIGAAPPRSDHPDSRISTPIGKL